MLATATVEGRPSLQDSRGLPVFLQLYIVLGLASAYLTPPHGPKDYLCTPLERLTPKFVLTLRATMVFEMPSHSYGGWSTTECEPRLKSLLDSMTAVAGIPHSIGGSSTKRRGPTLALLPAAVQFGTDS